MAAVAPPPPSIYVGSAREPPAVAAGSICAGRDFNEARAVPCGFLPWGVFLAVGRCLDPPSRQIWTVAAFSSPDSSPPPPLRIHSAPDGAAAEVLPLVRARTSSPSIALPLPSPACYKAEGPPADGLPEGEALHVGSRTRAASPHLLDQAGVHPDRLPEGEALRVGSRTCPAFRCLLDQAGVHPDGRPEAEALRVGSRTSPAIPSRVHQAQGHHDTPPEDFMLLIVSCMIRAAILHWDYNDIIVTDAVGSPRIDLSEAQSAAIPLDRDGAVMDEGGPRVLRPRLLGPIWNLPTELVLQIARVVARSSTRQAAAMKLCCRTWNGLFDIYGPFLAVNQQGTAASRVTLLKITAPEGPQGPLRMESVHCLSPPPVDTLCWGSAQGLLALRKRASNKAYLHCLTCGLRRPLPDVPPNHNPRGIYIRGGNFLLAVMDDLTRGGYATQDVHLDMCFLYLPQLNIDSGFVEGALMESDDEGIELCWTWGAYPGTESFSPMRTVNFMGSIRFVAATAFNVLIFDTDVREPHQPFLQIHLGELLNLDADTVIWMQNGHHLFTCGLAAYLCVLTRSMENPNEVGIRCFRIRRNVGRRFSLVEVRTIGQNSVYLGANQPIVLPALHGVAGRSPNTFYVDDNDGQFPNNMVLAINIRTQKVQEIPFPTNVIRAPFKSTASWATPPGENCHVG